MICGKIHYLGDGAIVDGRFGDTEDHYVKDGVCYYLSYADWKGGPREWLSEPISRK